MASIIEREEEAQAKIEGEAPWRRFVSDFSRSPLAILGLVVFGDRKSTRLNSSHRL